MLQVRRSTAKIRLRASRSYSVRARKKVRKLPRFERISFALTPEPHGSGLASLHAVLESMRASPSMRSASAILTDTGLAPIMGTRQLEREIPSTLLSTYPVDAHHMQIASASSGADPHIANLAGGNCHPATSQLRPRAPRMAQRACRTSGLAASWRGKTGPSDSNRIRLVPHHHEGTSSGQFDSPIRLEREFRARLGGSIVSGLGMNPRPVPEARRAQDGEAPRI